MVLTELEKKQRRKEYYQNNKEKVKEKVKEYYEDNKEHMKEYREKNKDKISKQTKKYYENNKEQIVKYKKEYDKTDIGKKSHTLSVWKERGLIETKEFIDEIYNMWLTQEECNACGIELTRTGKNSNTNANMDHDHSTGKFRHIICGYCNTMDNWKKYFII